jgi:hypothetical protein
MSSVPKGTTFRLAFREGMPPLAWGKPNSPRRVLCAVCHGALPEVPLMMWNSAGACVSFCDACVDKWITTKVL